MKFVAKFHGTAVYESSFLGYGYNSAGLCLPGIGIFIGKDTYSLDLDVIRHEYGHILQAQMIGYIPFYLLVGIPSLLSAWTHGYGKGHQQYWTEGWCNSLAKEYFSEAPWPDVRFPVRALTPNRLKWFRRVIDNSG